MSTTSTATTYTPMEVPEVFKNTLGDSWATDYNANNLSNKQKIAESYGSTINDNYWRQLGAAAKYAQQYDDNASMYADLVNGKIFDKLSSGEDLAKDYGTEGDYWTTWKDSKPTSEDFSDFLIDEDYYKDMASELLNKITIGYGDQSTSFIPGKSAEAYADIVEAMIGNKNAVSGDYGDSNESWLNNYANVQNNLLDFNSNLINQMLTGYASELEAGNAAADKRYQASTDVYDEYKQDLMDYPAGWEQEAAWNQAYNYGYPGYALAYYSTPSSETTKDTGTIGTINDALGTASNLTNTISGVTSLLSSVLGGSGYKGTGGTSGNTYSLGDITDILEEAGYTGLSG